MMLKSLRNAFITGIIILLPLGVTTFLVFFLINKIGAPLTNIFFWFLDGSLRSWPWVDFVLDVISTILVVVLITFLGLISRYFFGRLIFSLTEKIVSAVPFVSQVYTTAKQIVNTFSEQHKAVFQKVVLVEFPRKGCYALGFITSMAKGEVQLKTKETVVNVFVPTTPNPTSGFLIFIPKEEIVDLKMSITDGMKLVISGGAVVPNYPTENHLQNMGVKAEDKDKET